MYTQTIKIEGPIKNLKWAFLDGCPCHSDIIQGHSFEKVGIVKVEHDRCSEITYIFEDDIDIKDFVFFSEIGDLGCEVTSISKRALM